jgi:uncharacterized alpha-E superfamily protein
MSMLARVVESVYWFSRYLERAENTARLIGVNAHLMLDVPAQHAPGWLPLIDISGGRALFDEQQLTDCERDVVHFLIANHRNPGSICSSLKSARANARILRDVLPTDAWEVLNEFFQEFEDQLRNGVNQRIIFGFLKRIVLTMQQIAGVLDGAINRNEAHTFLMLGRNIERADMTSRIVDVRSAQLLPNVMTELRPFETIQWMSVLKSLSGYEMYRLAQRTRVARTDVLAFLLGGEQFPRACLFCLNEIELYLWKLPRSAGVLDAVRGASRFIKEARFDSLDQPGLHDLIDNLQLRIFSVHDALAGTYFPRREGAAVQRMTQYAGYQSSTMALQF